MHPLLITGWAFILPMLIGSPVNIWYNNTNIDSLVTLGQRAIFVRTTTPEPPGTHLNLRFQLPHAEDLPATARRGADEKIEVEGEVIWINPYRPGAPDNLHPGMGIRFVGLDDEVRDQLLELIRRFAYLS